MAFLVRDANCQVHDYDEPSLLLSMKRLFSLLACYSKGEQLCHKMQLIVAVAIAGFPSHYRHHNVSNRHYHDAVM